MGNKKDGMHPALKSILAGAFALIVLVLLQGPTEFLDWITGSFLLYVASFFFIWPVAKFITGQNILTFDSFVNVIIGFLAWLLSAFLNDMGAVTLVESFFTIVFIVGFLYSIFALLGAKLKWGGKKAEN